MNKPRTWSLVKDIKKSGSIVCGPPLKEHERVEVIEKEVYDEVVTALKAIHSDNHTEILRRTIWKIADRTLRELGELESHD